MKAIAGDSFGLRLMTALILLPLLAIIVWVPNLRLVFAALVIFLSFMGVWEYRNMIKVMSPELTGLKGLFIAPLLTAAFLAPMPDSFPPYMVMYLALLFLVVEQLISQKHSLASLVFSGFGVFYVGYLSSFFIAMHNLPGVGSGLVTFLVFAIGLSDTGAYVVGKAFGRHKLCPPISPNKTIEGSLAGIIAGILAGVLIYSFREAVYKAGFPEWPLWIYAVLGLGLSIVGQVGDLAESLIKRNAGVKDSGTLFPGHGGALDRCDAFLFGGPALYYAAMLLESLGYS